MPLRTVVSPLEALIIPAIKNYLLSSVSEEASKKSSTPEDGVKTLTDAIALGINEAFKSTYLSGMMGLVVDTNAAAVIPIGQTAHTAIMIPATEPTVLSPLL